MMSVSDFSGVVSLTPDRKEDYRAAGSEAVRVVDVNDGL
jgi:hypothetical protein